MTKSLSRVLAKEESSLAWIICKNLVQRSFDCPAEAFSTSRLLSFCVLPRKAKSTWGANRANFAVGTFWLRLIRHSGHNGLAERSILDPRYEQGESPISKAANRSSRPVPSGEPISTMVLSRPNALSCFPAAVRVDWNWGNASWND